ncbi:MAG: hypothetical protein NVS4B3_21590 [Gemmatimonadaceae bacterium]
MREDRPSSTATLIAAATLFLSRSRRDASMVPPGAAEWCARSLESLSPWHLPAVLAMSHPALRWLPRLAERATVPGLLLHFMVRKRWIEEAVRESLAGGSEQVVIIGAGFDTLALRLCDTYPHVRFIEIDHPATQRVKQLAVTRRDDGHATGPIGNLHFIAADLSRKSLQTVLSAVAAFSPDRPSTFVIEGLLMYLTDAEVAGMFTVLRAVLHGHGRVVFSVIEPTPHGLAAFHNATPLVRWLLAHWREPFKSVLARDAVAPFLERSGFRLRDTATSETLRARYLSPIGREESTLARGEMIVVADTPISR